MKNSYWSCSKFADWLRGIPKPHSGSEEEWKTWERSAKAKKIRYWLAEEGLDFLQNLVRWPLNLRHYVDNRWFAKTHALTSNLKRGQWHDFNTRLLHALFDELVNFVEIDQAWHLVQYSEEDRKKYRLPWYRKIFSWRCKEAGLAYLEWAAGLKNEENWIDQKNPSFGQPTPQALAAQQTILLYKWWKEERPGRLDPMDASGLSDYYEKKRQESEAQGYELSWICCDIDEPYKEHTSKMLKICLKIEQEQKAEDTEMLIRLIKIRGSLWT